MEVQYLHTMHTLRNQLTMYHIHYKLLIAGPKNAMPKNQQEHLPPIYYVYAILVPGIQTRPLHAHEYGEFHQ